MKIEKNEIPSFGKAYGLLNRSFIAINKSLCIEYANDYAIKLLNLNKRDLLIGQSLIKVFEDKKLPELIDLNGKMINKIYIIANEHVRQWKKMKITVGHEQWFFFVDEDVSEKENIYHVLKKVSVNTTGHPFNIATPIDQYIKIILNYFTNIIDTIPCIVYWKNKHLQYIGCNKMAADFLHFKSIDGVIGKTDFDLFPDRKLAKSYRSIDREILRTGNPLINEPGQLINDKGERFLTLVSKVPIKSHAGDIIGIIGITIDITKEKQAEVAKDDFLSNMEHDLRTPFAGIGGVADLLHSIYSEKYPELKDLFKILVKSCFEWQVIHNRIFDALDLKQDIKVESFYIQDELEKIQNLMGSTSKIKQVDFLIESPSRKETGKITTDNLKFTLILSSLIGNAFNFTEKGQITVKLSRLESSFIIEVIDTGVGIPDDKLEYIFEKFTKLSRSNTYGGTFKGVGMGLYNAKKDAERIQGSISVNSTLILGSVFTLTLPIQLRLS